MQTSFPEMVLTSNQCHVNNSGIDAESNDFGEAKYPDSILSISQVNFHLRMCIKNLFEDGRTI